MVCAVISVGEEASSFTQDVNFEYLFRGKEEKEGKTVLIKKEERDEKGCLRGIQEGEGRSALVETLYLRLRRFFPFLFLFLSSSFVFPKVRFHNKIHVHDEWKKKTGFKCEKERVFFFVTRNRD